LATAALLLPLLAGSLPGPAQAWPFFSTSDRTLAYGLSVIQDRYVSPVHIPGLTYEGLQSLTSLDPALSIQQNAEGGWMRLSHDGKEVETYPLPADDAPDAWGELAQDLLSDAQRVSEPLRQAGRDKAYNSFFTAVLARLDRFSRYADPKEAEERRSMRSGYGGIGLRYDAAPDGVVVLEVLADAPAAKARIKVGDHILAADGTPLAGLDVKTIAHMIRGPLYSPVVLSVLSPDSRQVISRPLFREQIIPPTVRTSQDADGVATIAIASFNEGTAGEVSKALQKAKASPGFKGVVLDLRGNPGGLLDRGVAVADLFIEAGRIVTTRGRNPASMQAYSARSGDPGEGMPLVVLIDGKSASAAEIAAAALEDSGRAVLVGTNSYGKGTVQTVVALPNGAEMTLTWSRYITPSGYVLHDLGILPSICTAGLPKAETVLAQVAERRLPATALLSSWRASAPDQAEERKQMRQSCPAADHRGKELDAAIAHKLLLDPALYAKALSASAPAEISTSSP